MAEKHEFEVTHENEVKRDPDKARYDVESIRKIMEETHFVNVSFVDEDGNPQCIPMVHAITQTNSTLHVYLHGYHRARLVRLLPPETRVCITATLFDGLVLALSAFSSSINHRSAVLHGVVCEWDEDGAQARAEKWEAARQITEHVMPGRWADCRQPSNAEMNTTGFVKVAITSASAKCRAGQPGEEKRDLADAALVGKTWAGVIPARTTYGTPQAGEYSRAAVPGYIAEYIANDGVLSG